MTEEKKTTKVKDDSGKQATVAEKPKPKAEQPKAAETPKPKAKDGKDCTDRNCPTHGTLSTRGAVFDGIVVSDKMRGSVVVLREQMIKSKKYERYLRSRSRISAHNPPCINAKTDDKVKIMECRKLSKTISFVVIEKQDG